MMTAAASHLLGLVENKALAREVFKTSIKIIPKMDNTKSLKKFK